MPHFILSDFPTRVGRVSGLTYAGVDELTYHPVWTGTCDCGRPTKHRTDVVRAALHRKGRRELSCGRCGEYSREQRRLMADAVAERIQRETGVRPDQFYAETATSTEPRRLAARYIFFARLESKLGWSVPEIALATGWRPDQVWRGIRRHYEKRDASKHTTG